MLHFRRDIIILESDLMRAGGQPGPGGADEDFAQGVKPGSQPYLPALHANTHLAYIFTGRYAYAKHAIMYTYVYA
jgi:hypothetical protein